MKAIIQLKAVYRPVSRALIGLRLQAAVPNMASRKMLGKDNGDVIVLKTEVPSFRGQYLIAESMDYATLFDVTPAEIERFKERVRREGFTEFAHHGKRIEDALTLAAMTA